MAFSVLIFGANGFIGKNVFQFLKKEYNVTTCSLRTKESNIDFSNYEVYLNFVGKAHDHNKTASEEDFYHVNVDLTKNIFNAFIKSEAKIFIHISSLAALEEFESLKPLTEEDSCNPNSWYGKSKRKAEKWLLEQRLPENKKLIILRPPMVHGPGDKGNLGLLYKLISRGIPYPLSSFENKRSFISIDNFCFFIDEIIKNEGKLVSGIYHISDDELISTNQIIDIIKKVEKKNTPDLSLPKFFVKGLAKIGDIIPIPLNSLRLKKMTSDLTVSNQKIKSALGIEQLPLSAEEGLIKTIKSFKREK
ncbi:NAD-dependent epimerase/dehydratase family protein [Chryseobacterium geocarposphaerae]|uniref:Nucleoside-diphosphate-sugar epimerase n=1 Tax=Chryseobacterium geocarposphaerae TaxID=1416776 RepID=A0A2M9CAM8_9FLAO|nr:NAD-dependent epimerase/dehydratase family protein [Chryseobacterium geocarposphaerae]PJJ67822.1 nucleoside-diphosphate-sugar epimerase [Chryseobacterium geocarposphaerae]